MNPYHNHVAGFGLGFTAFFPIGGSAPIFSAFPGRGIGFGFLNFG